MQLLEPFHFQPPLKIIDRRWKATDGNVPLATFQFHRENLNNAVLLLYQEGKVKWQAEFPHSMACWHPSVSLFLVGAQCFPSSGPDPSPLLPESLGRTRDPRPFRPIISRAAGFHNRGGIGSIPTRPCTMLPDDIFGQGETGLLHQRHLVRKRTSRQ